MYLRIVTQEGPGSPRTARPSRPPKRGGFYPQPTATPPELNTYRRVTTMTSWLSVKEAAARAGVSESIVRGWLRDGSLAHYRLGAKGRRGKIAISVEDLDGLLASFRVVTPQVNESQRQPAPPARKPILKHLRLK